MALGRKKKIALAMVGGALALPIIVFMALFARYDRGGDPNNEDSLLALARKAQADDNPPLAAEYWRRLVALHPFNKEYKKEHFHALLRARQFNRLSAAYADTFPPESSMTDDERKFEDLVAEAGKAAAAGEYDWARDRYIRATNLNYYAAAPLLIDLEVRHGRMDRAMELVRPYVRRFPEPRLLVYDAEWCALAARADLIPEIKSSCPPNRKFPSVAFDHYCDALVAWTKGETNKLANAKVLSGDDYFDTPLSKLMRLESAVLGDDPDLVAAAYQELRGKGRFLDFLQRGRLAVKRFVAAHFPDRLSLEQMGGLADLVLADGDPDLDLLRVALLGKLETKTLHERDLDEADKLFPGDNGLKLIRKWHAETASR